MWVDLGVGVVVVLYGLIGLFQGVIVQLFRLSGLVLIVVYARFVAEPVGQWLAAKLGLNALIAYYISFIVGSLVVYAVCALIGRGVTKVVAAGGGAPRKVNRTLGGLLGLAKGLVVAFILVSVLDMIPQKVLARWEAVEKQVAASRILPHVHRVNPLPELRFVTDIDDYKRLLESPEAQRILQGTPEFVRLQDHPKFRQAVSDPKLRELIKAKPPRWPEVLVHEKVIALGFDREIREILNDEKFRAALQAALQQAKKPPSGE
ncbi:MAG: hypothetical protein AMS16_05680 [Planctomycetes bacterium DG_58]|nr:MAG: hypothetical protein AMS16_05680 [Planctomycetes bacterium DG_58]KPL01435.1 MAG: hypothetical protein AMK75_04955 [Planctomycetes bacterium SM23_65]